MKFYQVHAEYKSGRMEIYCKPNEKEAKKWMQQLLALPTIKKVEIVPVRGRR